MNFLEVMSEGNQSSSAMETTPPAVPPKPTAPPAAVSARPSRERKQVEVFKPPTEGERKKDISVVEGAGITLGDYAYFNDQWVSILSHPGCFVLINNVIVIYILAG